MKILKYVGLIVLIIIAIPLISALFISKDYGVVEKIIIERPIAEVYEFTKYLKNQDQFSKWALMDPEMEKYYEGEDGTVGFVAGWKSENPDVGHGEQEILAIKEMERIDYELRFIEPFESTDKAYLAYEPLGPNQTEVTWGFEGHMSYPMNVMIPLMNIENMLAEDFQTGLSNLKKIMEK